MVLGHTYDGILKPLIRPESIDAYGAACFMCLLRPDTHLEAARPK
jgi:hypothetical protein